MNSWEKRCGGHGCWFLKLDVCTTHITTCNSAGLHNVPRIRRGPFYRKREMELLDLESFVPSSEDEQTERRWPVRRRRGRVQKDGHGTTRYEAPWQMEPKTKTCGLFWLSENWGHRCFRKKKVSFLGEQRYTHKVVGGREAQMTCAGVSEFNHIPSKYNLAATKPCVHWVAGPDKAAGGNQ